MDGNALLFHPPGQISSHKGLKLGSGLNNLKGSWALAFICQVFPSSMHFQIFPNFFPNFLYSTLNFLISSSLTLYKRT
jgi:hypothetical protein